MIEINALPKFTRVLFNGRVFLFTGFARNMRFCGLKAADGVWEHTYVPVGTLVSVA
jgi:hypothetical protein